MRTLGASTEHELGDWPVDAGSLCPPKLEDGVDGEAGSSTGEESRELTQLGRRCAGELGAEGEVRLIAITVVFEPLVIDDALNRFEDDTLKVNDGAADLYSARAMSVRYHAALNDPSARGCEALIMPLVR